MLLPIAVVLVLMIGARWTAARAGLAGVAVTTVIAVAVFGLGSEVLTRSAPPGRWRGRCSRRPSPPAGFGASVALAAPFLVSAGFTRVQAVTAAPIGHAVDVSFGAVGLCSAPS